MGSELLLGVRLNPESFKTIKLSDINLKTRVEDLRLETAERIELSKDSFGKLKNLFTKITE